MKDILNDYSPQLGGYTEVNYMDVTTITVSTKPSLSKEAEEFMRIMDETTHIGALIYYLREYGWNFDIESKEHRIRLIQELEEDVRLLAHSVK